MILGAIWFTLIVAMATLYRKYRPKTFSEVVGQERVTHVLLEELKQAKTAHAYLFSGPRGTGKTSVARLFAKALNCERRRESGESCNECDSCQRIAKAASADLIEIDAASNRRIDEVRELREHVRYVPASSAYKVYIIDEVHMLTTEAWNALLKTLEEPPPHAVFILATTELHKIPDTIFSRCQHFSFSKLAIAHITERLALLARAEGVTVAREVLAEIARRSGGALRDGESLLGQILSIGKQEIGLEDASMFLPTAGFSNAFSWLELLVRGDARAAFAKLRTFEEAGVNIDVLLSDVLEIARNVLIGAATGDASHLALSYGPDEVARISAMASEGDVARIRTIVAGLLSAAQEMKLFADMPALPLELAVVEICEDKKQDARNKMQEITDTNTTEDSEVKKNEQSAQTASIINQNHSLADILDGWGEVLTRVKDKSTALNFILGVAAPVAVRGEIVELGFKYRLQQEKVQEAENRHVVERIMSEVYGTKYRIETSLNDSVKTAASDEEILVKTALEIFKGAVIEQ